MLRQKQVKEDLEQMEKVKAFFKSAWFIVLSVIALLAIAVTTLLVFLPTEWRNWALDILDHWRPSRGEGKIRITNPKEKEDKQKAKNIRDTVRDFDDG